MKKLSLFTNLFYTALFNLTFEQIQATEEMGADSRTPQSLHSSQQRLLDQIKIIKQDEKLAWEIAANDFNIGALPQSELSKTDKETLAMRQNYEITRANLKKMEKPADSDEEMARKLANQSFILQKNSLENITFSKPEPIDSLIETLEKWKSRTFCELYSIYNNRVLPLYNNIYNEAQIGLSYIYNAVNDFNASTLQPTIEEYYPKAVLKFEEFKGYSERKFKELKKTAMDKLDNRPSSYNPNIAPNRASNNLTRR